MNNPTAKIKKLPTQLLKTWGDANNSNVWAHCASVGFFGFLSIFPVMAVFVLLYGLIFSPAEMQEQINFLRQFIPPSVYDVLNARLSQLVSNTSTRLPCWPNAIAVLRDTFVLPTPPLPPVTAITFTPLLLLLLILRRPLA